GRLLFLRRRLRALRRRLDLLLDDRRVAPGRDAEVRDAFAHARRTAIRLRDHVAARILELEHEIDALDAGQRHGERTRLRDIDPVMIDVAVGIDPAAHRRAERQRRRGVIAIVRLDLVARRAGAAAVDPLRADLDRGPAAFAMLLAATAARNDRDEHDAPAHHTTLSRSARPARNSADDTTLPSTLISPFILKIFPLRSGTTSMWS